MTRRRPSAPVPADRFMLVGGVAVLSIILVVVTVQVYLVPELMAHSPVPMDGWMVPAVIVTFGIANAAALVGAKVFSRPVRLGLLAVQLLLAAPVTSDLMYLTAAQVPLVLPGWFGVAWLIFETIASTSFVLLHVSIHPMVELPNIPFVVFVAMYFAAEFGWRAFAFFVGWALAAEQRHRIDLATVNRQLRTTQAWLASRTRAEERLALSRELHDSVGHNLAALSVTLDLAARQTPTAREPLRDAQALVRQLLSDVRQVVDALRPPLSVALEPGLKALAATVPGLDVQVRVTPELEPTADQAHALFRCAQEALTNSLRHAEASVVWIDVGRESNGIRLHIRDDGKGAPALQPGHGLEGMKERVEALEGHLHIDAAPPGFVVAVWLPGSRSARASGAQLQPEAR